jgi:hypothetical protein
MPALTNAALGDISPDITLATTSGSHSRLTRSMLYARLLPCGKHSELITLLLLPAFGGLWLLVTTQMITPPNSLHSKPHTASLALRQPLGYFLLAGSGSSASSHDPDSE